MARLSELPERIHDVPYGAQMAVRQANQELIGEVRAALLAVADPGKAPQMQKYMKSSMPYCGVPLPLLRSTLRPVYLRHELPSAAVLDATVGAIWDDAQFREERYAGIALARHRFYADLQTPARLPLYRRLIVTGAWWDYVDEIADNLVGPILRGFPDKVTPLLVGWSTDSDRWIRRSAIIAQIGSKGETDVDLLSRAIEPNLDDPDFFIRKAIGWALRQYARTDPDWVRRYVAAHETQLSGLSRREATKHL